MQNQSSSQNNSMDKANLSDVCSDVSDLYQFMEDIEEDLIQETNSSPVEFPTGEAQISESKETRAPPSIHLAFDDNLD